MSGYYPPGGPPPPGAVPGGPAPYPPGLGGPLPNGMPPGPPGPRPLGPPPPGGMMGGPRPGMPPPPGAMPPPPGPGFGAPPPPGAPGMPGGPLPGRPSGPIPMPGPQPGMMGGPLVRPQGPPQPAQPPQPVPGAPPPAGAPLGPPGSGPGMRPMGPPAPLAMRMSGGAPMPPPLPSPGSMMPSPPGPGGMMPPPPGPGGMMPPPGPPGSMMPPPPGPGGMMPPPPPGAGGMVPPPMGMPPGHYGAHYGAQQLVEQFESLMIGGPGMGQEGVDLNALPRPVGELRDKALEPPPPYDMYNCSPDNMRMTTNAIPNSTALRARWPLPIGAIVHPMADELRGRQVPVINLGSAGIIRCKKCRTYMNPFMTWMDGGRRFKCNVCALQNEVPIEYYSPLGQDGRRVDFGQRPELCSGTVEYVAPAEYMVRPPMPPVYFFVIDVSYSAVQSGMVATVCAALKGILDQLPGEERTLVGFLTFDSSLHFYNLKPGLKEPQMMVVAEVEEPFLPLPDDLLVNLSESRSVVEALLDSLPTTFANTSISDSAMGPALQAAFLAMQHVGGKLELFQASVPNVGPGKVKNREAVTAYGTDREASLRQPEDPFFKRFAAECSRQQITLDAYTFSSMYMDLASVAAMPRFTCGELFHYPGFNSSRDGTKLTRELQHCLARPTAWEAVMRIRCSRGLRISSFHGHFFNRSTDLLALPTCDPDKAFAVQIGLEENMVNSTVGYVQCALLYTNSNGERRIRVHTLAVPIVTELNELFKAADGPACAALLGKVMLEKALSSRLDETRSTLFNKVMGLLKEFRLMHASTAARQPNRLIYPEALRCVPLWGLGLVKCAALRGGAKDVNPDERMVVGHELMAASVEGMCRGVYPDLYPLHETGGDWGIPRGEGEAAPLPLTTPLSGAYLEERGAYLLDNGRVFVLWLGHMLDRNWGQQVFGMDLASPEANDPARLHVEPARPGSPLSARVNAVLATLRAGRAVHQQCFVVRQRSPLEVHIAQYFVEDRGPATQSYTDWVMALHKAVTAK